MAKKGKRSQKNPRKNITRIENVTTADNFSCGWEVRMQRRGKTVEKYFSDANFGGSRKALAAAKKFRDELDASMKPYTVKEMAKRPSVRNTSGIVGVRFEDRVTVDNGYEYYYPTWIAQWTDADGRRRTKTFSEAKYGKKQAKDLAIKARKKGVNDAARAIKS